MTEIFDRCDDTTFTHPEVQTKFNYLKTFYGNDYKRFEEEIAKDGVHDDRQLYINLFDMLCEGIETMDKIYKESVLVDCAFTDTFTKETKTLTDIQKHFSKETV